MLVTLLYGPCRLSFVFHPLIFKNLGQEHFSSPDVFKQRHPGLKSSLPQLQYNKNKNLVQDFPSASCDIFPKDILIGCIFYVLSLSFSFFIIKYLLNHY